MGEEERTGTSMERGCEGEMVISWKLAMVVDTNALELESDVESRELRALLDVDSSCLTPCVLLRDLDEA